MIRAAIAALFVAGTIAVLALILASLRVKGKIDEPRSVSEVDTHYSDL